MKTENEYAEMLIEQYKQISIYPMSCAINDVQNTIEAITLLTSGHYTDELIQIELDYYNNVLNILKAKL